ncbi:MAG: Methyltransferase type 11, partial [bacterium]|nr:Methyltransferase type 11 [bacterium]
MGSRVYAGRTASTRIERVTYSCPCGERFAAEVWRAVDARDEAEAKRLYDGTLNQVRCPSCEARAEVQVPVVFHDAAHERLVLVLPDGLRHRELAERAALFTQLAEDGVAPAAYVLEPAVVFGAAGLRALLAPPPSDA